MPWVWDKQTMQMHDLSRRDPRCGVDALTPEHSKVYEDEITATTVLKTQHLIPCRWCYRPKGRTTM